MVTYFKGVIREFSYIRWLSIRRTIAFTIFIIAVALFLGFSLGAVDSFLASILRGIVI